MPEYLAPGVYVEEVDTGDKPIEGVSTSIAGMVGLTARGPVGVPTLVTSVADFTRQFGGRLDHRLFPDNTAHLPLAIEGFFANSGQLVFVVRVLPDGASASAAQLFDRGDGAVRWTASLASVAAKGDTVLLVSAPSGPIGPSDWFLVDDPSGAEFLQAQPASVVTLETPLVQPLAAGANVSGATLTPGAAAPTTLAAPATAGQLTLDVADVTNIHAGSTLIVGARPAREVVSVASTTPAPAAPAGAAPAGTVTITAPLANGYAGGAAVRPVTPAPTGSSLAAAPAAPGDRLVAVQGPRGNLPPGDGTGAVSLGAGASVEWHFIGDGELLVPSVPLAHNHLAGAEVAAATLTAAGAARALTADVAAGAVELPVDDVSGLVAGMVLALGPAASPTEHAVVERAPGIAGPGTIGLTTPTLKAYPNGTVVTPLTDATPAAPARLTTLARGAHPGESVLYMTDSGIFQPSDVLRVGGAGGDYVTQPANAGPAPQIVVLTAPPRSAHRAGLAVAGRGVIGSVQAVDLGAWGDSLQVMFADEVSPILDTVPTEAVAAGALDVALASVTGIEPGTILEFYTGSAASPQKVCIQQVSAVSGRTAAFDQPLAAAVDTTMRVRTREVQMTVQGFQVNPRTLVAQPVAALAETIHQLSMDPRHSRYFVTIIGAIPAANGPRTDGESLLVRVSDTGAKGTLRLGPDDHWQQLAGGSDSLDTLVDTLDDTYLGTDAIDPAARTGLQALKNIEEISLVAIPGITTQPVQNGLIDHCELLRYRFAVLDAGRGDTIEKVQQQRNLYDTKYAALYYPWLEISDPFPANPRAPGELPVPPSGHVLGIYARVDNDRGVHKAPANEEVLGIDALEVRVVKQQQDILNPRNINVLRDFTDNQRGLRVWGARCLTSDPDWKYVNVRRLFIFLEASLDRGTQWVVFEPNDEQTWARVRQSVTAFLTDVWRGGALMGKTADQAFFVKCDTTTMTQADIDNGRLIMVIGVAAVRPAEFVIIRIGQWAGGAMAQQA